MLSFTTKWRLVLRARYSDTFGGPSVFVAFTMSARILISSFGHLGLPNDSSAIGFAIQPPSAACNSCNNGSSTYGLVIWRPSVPFPFKWQFGSRPLYWSFPVALYNVSVAFSLGIRTPLVAYDVPFPCKLIPRNSRPLYKHLWRSTILGYTTQWNNSFDLAN